MNQSRTIKVFLGSSVVELKNERQDLNSLSNEIINLLRQDNIFATFVKSEDMGITVENFKEHDQARIDKELLTCDLSLFLFKTRAGEGTCHEYDVACDLQKKRKNHKITICCLNVSENKKDDSLKAFQKKIVTEGGYWENCRDLSEVRRVISFNVLHYLGITLPTTTEADAAEKQGNVLFSIFRETEQGELKPQLHSVIDELMEQIPVIMASSTDSVVAKIVKASELYYKANLWASKTEYDEEKQYSLLFAYAEFLNDYAMYNDALAISRQALAFSKKLYNIVHEKTADTYNNIGRVYKNQGMFSLSMKYFRKALKIRKDLFGEEDGTTATSYNNIGALLNDQGKYSLALEYYFKALGIREKVHGKYHASSGSSYNNIGLTFFNQGNYSKALEYDFIALDVKRKVLGEIHEDVANTYCNIGQVYDAINEYTKALEYYEKTLKIDKELIGDEHPATATVYNNIGGVYKNQSNYEKALEYCTKALRIRETTLGYDHPLTAQSYNNTGTLYYMMSHYCKALEYFEKALRIRTDKLGADHQYTRKTLEWINLTRAAMNEDTKALEGHLSNTTTDQQNE